VTHRVKICDNLLEFVKTLFLKAVAYRAAEPELEPELGILTGAGAGTQIKNQEPELSFKFRTGAGAMATSEEAPAPGPFLETNGYTGVARLCVAWGRQKKCRPSPPTHLLTRI